MKKLAPLGLTLLLLNGCVHTRQVEASDYRGHDSYAAERSQAGSHSVAYALVRLVVAIFHANHH